MTYRKHLYPPKIGLTLAFASIFLYFFFNLWPLIFSIAMAFTNANERNLYVNPEVIVDLNNAILCIDNLKKDELRRDASRVLNNTIRALHNLQSLVEGFINAVNESEDPHSDEIYSNYVLKMYDEAAADIELAIKEIDIVFNCTRYGYKTKKMIIEADVIESLDVLNEKVAGIESSFFQMSRDELLRSASLVLNISNRAIEYLAIRVADYEGFIDSIRDSFVKERDEKTLKFVGLSNFSALFRDPRFYYSLYKTLLFVVTSVPMKVGVGFALALLYSSNLIIGRKWLRGLMLTPWAIPILLSGLTWNFLFQPNGQLGRLLGINIDVREWDAFLVYNLFETWLAYPFIMTVTMGALASIPRDIIEASYVDGANLWFRVRRVVFPLIARPLAVASILTTGASLQAFLVPLLINKGGPTGTVSVIGVGSRTGNLNELLILFGYNRAHIDKEWGYAAATYLAIVMIIMIYVAVWFTIYRRSRR